MQKSVEHDSRPDLRLISQPGLQDRWQPGAHPLRDGLAVFVVIAVRVSQGKPPIEPDKRANVRVLRNEPAE